MAQAWERLAGRTGGTITALARARREDGSPLVFAATAVGLHVSGDGGRSWRPLSAKNVVPFVEAVAVLDPFGEAGRLFAGARNGLYRSTDGGESWQVALPGQRVSAIAVAPVGKGEPALFAGTEAEGVQRSTDGGETWTSANDGLTESQVLALALSPDFERAGIGFVATPAGLFRTENRGKSWTAVELGVAQPAVQCLAVSPAFGADGLVLAGTEADGLLRSTDRGKTWQPVAELAGGGVLAVACSPSDPQTIAAATGDGIAISRDGGVHWQLTGRELGPALSLLFAPAGSGEALIAGLPNAGIVRSEDGGATWAPANDGLNASLLSAIAVSPAYADDRTLFVAGLEDGVLTSTDGGRSWRPANHGLDDTAVSALAVSPGFSRDRTLFAATATGLYRSRDAAESWAPIGPAGAPAGALAIASRADGDRIALVAALGGEIRASDDGGETWRALGGEFGGAAIVSIALSPNYPADGTIFVGTSRPLSGGGSELCLWRSTAGGGRWERWFEERGNDVLPLVVPPSYVRNGDLFVGVGRRVKRPLRDAQEIRRGARRPIWRSVQLGDATTSITALAASPAFLDDATLFAATNAGVFVSRDGGERFEPWSEGLEPVAVLALALSPGYARDRLVFAIGLGGTIWRRRDA